MRNLMGLAHGADFEWSKTGDVRSEYMENDDEVDNEANLKDGRKVRLYSFDSSFFFRIDS